MTRLTRPECMAFLSRHHVGRVAATQNALPVIVPVNFLIRGDQVVFRTDSSGLLGRACDRAVVAFEVDDLDADGVGGTSVLVVGEARRLQEHELHDILAAGLVSAMGPSRDAYVAIPLDRVSGRLVRAEVDCGIA